MQGEPLDLVHLLAEPAAHAREHPKAGIHRLAQHAAHHLVVESEQHARRERFGTDRIAAARLHEHHRLRERLLRLDDLDDLLAAARRAAKELELARTQVEELPRRLPVVEQPLAVIKPDHAGVVDHDPKLP